MSVRNERGGGMIKTIVVVAAVLYVVYMSIKIVSTKSDDKAFEARVEEIAKYAGVNRMDAPAIQYAVMKAVGEKGVPLEAKDLKVVEEGASWHVTYTYDNSQKLVFWKWEDKVSYDKPIPKG